MKIHRSSIWAFPGPVTGVPGARPGLAPLQRGHEAAWLNGLRLLGSAYLAFLFFQLVSHKKTLENEEGELTLGRASDAHWWLQFGAEATRISCVCWSKTKASRSDTDIGKFVPHAMHDLRWRALVVQLNRLARR